MKILMGILFLLFSTTAKADHLRCWWDRDVIFDVNINKSAPEIIYSPGKVMDAWGVIRQSGEPEGMNAIGDWPLPSLVSGATYQFSDKNRIHYSVYQNLCLLYPGEDVGPSLAGRLNSCNVHLNSKAWHVLIPWYYYCKP